MIIPPYLKSGETIALIAPSRFVESENIDAFKIWAENQNWNVLESPNLYSKENQFAGSNSLRIEDISWALNHSKIKAVFACRGGYGSMPLLESLKTINFTKNPKWWIGFSDVTALHFLFQKQGLSSIHGPMPFQFNKGDNISIENFNHLSLTLQGKKSIIHKVTLNDGFNLRDFSGELWGGNLSIVFAMLSANIFPDFTNKIIFLEDLDEYYYHIDRMIVALKLRGVFEQCKGILIGSMIDMHDNAIPFGKTTTEILLDAAKDYNVPIIFNVPCGHGPKNIALKMGMNCTFDGSILFQD